MALNVRHVANVVAGPSEIRRAPVPRALMRLRPREIVNDVRDRAARVSAAIGILFYVRQAPKDI